MVFETSEVVLPAFVRRSKLYQATVARVLRLVVEMVGGVLGVFGKESMPVRELAVRKLAGNAVELAGFLAFGWSPVWLLAAADVRMAAALLTSAGGRAETSPGLPADSDITRRSAADVLERRPQGSRHHRCTAAERADLRSSCESCGEHCGLLPRRGARRCSPTFWRACATAAGETGRVVESVGGSRGTFMAWSRLGMAHVVEYYSTVAGRNPSPDGLHKLPGAWSGPYARGAAGEAPGSGAEHVHRARARPATS